MLSGKLAKGAAYCINEAEPSITSENEVKIRVKYVSICGYEMMIYNGSASPNPDRGIGHEVSGTVVETGAAVTDLMAGDNVVIPLSTPCGKCSECLNKRFNYCLNTHSESNGMREFIVCPSSSVYKLGNLSLREGCLIEPLTMALSTKDHFIVHGGESVLILGAGAMGIMLLKLLKLYPVGKIVMTEPNNYKRILAKKFGADLVLDPGSDSFDIEVFNATSSHAFDIVIEASGSQASAETAFQYVNRGGHLIFYGLYGMNYELPLNLFNLYWKDVTINAVLPHNYLYSTAIELAPRMQLEELITAEYPLEHIYEAFEAKSSGEHLKVVIKV